MDMREVEAWEQGAKHLASSSRAMLRLIDTSPATVLSMLDWLLEALPEAHRIWESYIRLTK